MHPSLAWAIASSWWGCSASGPADPQPRPWLQPPPPGTTAALAWTADLTPGHVVVGADVAVADLPDLAPNPIRAPAEAIGATVREPVYAGEPVRSERLVRRDDGVTGLAALVPEGQALAVVDVPVHALAGIDPGCAIEVIDPGSGRRAAATTLAADLGDDGAARLAVAAAPGAALPGLGASAHDRFTAVSLALDDAGENAGPIAYTPPDRPGQLLAVALRTLAPGVMVRSDDLGEVGGLGVDGVDGALRLPEVWARYPILPIYAGELPNPRRIAGSGRGACTAIPSGMRGVAVPTQGTPAEDWVGGLARVRAATGSTMEDLYVGAVYPVMAVTLVYADPKRARALAIAAAGGAPFEVTPEPALILAAYGPTTSISTIAEAPRARAVT